MSDTDGQFPAPQITLSSSSGDEVYTDESLAKSPDESATATQEGESPIADIVTEEPRPVSDETTEKLKKAQNTAREQSGHFAELAKALLNNPDKEAVKAILADKPHLEREIRRRYPDELKKFSQDDVQPTKSQESPLNQVVSVAEKELQMEQAIDARMFQKENGIADDEMGRIKTFANSLSQTDPSLTFSKALELAMSVERPTRTTPQSKAPMGIPRDEGSEYADDSLDIKGFNGRLNGIAKDLRKMGVGVSNEDGNFVLRA